MPIDARLNGAAVRNFAGCAIEPVDPETLQTRLLARFGSGERGLIIGHHNLHSLYLYQHDSEARTFYQRCHTCYVDGMGVLWLLRAAGIDTREALRFSLMDCLPDFFDWAQSKHLSIFYLGASPTAVETAREWIARRWPQLQISLHHGYLDTPEVQHQVHASINALRPDLLLGGMGMPNQEAWINAHANELNVGAILQAGGTLDYYTGVQARPPRILSRLGLAWLYRLLHDPRRLWRRYLLTPWSLLQPTLRLRRALKRQQEML